MLQSNPSPHLHAAEDHVNDQLPRTPRGAAANAIVDKRTAAFYYNASCLMCFALKCFALPCIEQTYIIFNINLHCCSIGVDTINNIVRKVQKDLLFFTIYCFFDRYHLKTQLKYPDKT